MYLVFDESKHNDWIGCIIGVTDHVEEIIDYIKDNINGANENFDFDLISIDIKQLNYNEPYFIEIPDSEDMIIVIKVKDGLK